MAANSNIYGVSKRHRRQYQQKRGSGSGMAAGAGCILLISSGICSGIVIENSVAEQRRQQQRKSEKHGNNKA